MERVSEEMSAADKDEAEKHPDALLMLGVTIWATRRIAGDEVTFGDAGRLPAVGTGLAARHRGPEAGERQGPQRAASRSPRLPWRPTCPRAQRVDDTADLRTAVPNGEGTLTHLIPSVSVWNVGPALWAWRMYARMVDEWVKQQKEAERRG